MFRIKSFPALLLTMTMVCGCTTSMSSQASPLTQEQLQKLIAIHAPDEVIAHEIGARGLAFAPTREVISHLQSMGAGASTLSQIRALLPMLDEAKTAIPLILTKLYLALDQGNPSAIQAYVSQKIASDPATLDKICKPFSYRAHYIEAIVERPQRQFEARVRLLSKPMQERAYVLWFGVVGERFQLQEVSDPDPDWFQPRLAEAQEIARKFLYAINARRFDVARQLVSPSLSDRVESSSSLGRLQTVAINSVQQGYVGVEDYKGEKIRCTMNLVSSQGSMEYMFLMEPVGDKLPIVAWTDRPWQQGYTVEDPGLVNATLARFKLPPAQNSNLGEESASSEATAGTECGTYAACLQDGLDAYKSSDWQTATTRFEAAARYPTDNGGAWLWLGRVFLLTGQSQKVANAWDNALSRGAKVVIGACHERAFLPCEPGDLFVDSKSVSFVVNGKGPVFASTPGQIEVKGAMTNPVRGSHFLALRINNKNYNLDFLPLGVQCQVQIDVQCPPQGTSQQLLMERYVSQAISKLASGEPLGARSAPDARPQFGSIVPRH